MSKGDETRRRVLTQAGSLMNRTGYLSTSLSAILDAVDLQKGGLYNHFGSKDELSLEAFRANADLLGNHLGAIARSPGDPAEALFRLIDASIDVAQGRIVPGGCPVLNAGIEADDSWEPLRQASARAADALRRYFLLPLHRLERAGRLRSGTDVDGLALLLVAAVEGGILWARVTRDGQGQTALLATLRGLVAERILP
jgi:TetR/AcrR family transcriptional repressor of nem operon